ncbi:MAG: ketoacyl-ACP synthase III [Chitinophagaceae bacterium]|nr:ketoacyl-ACP synthase III [Chitinophagaceae bacterium]
MSNFLINYGIGISGASHSLGSKVQSNEELCLGLENTTPDWIISKTGIKRRYHVAENETASSLALGACKELIEKYSVNLNEVGLIIVASFSQDYLFPPLSAKIHKDLGLPKSCQIIDLNTNCTGLVTALTTASERMIMDKSIKTSIVIGVEVLSKFTNPKDADTAVFFSDGASATLLTRVEEGAGYVCSSYLTDSSTYESVRMRGGGSSFPVGTEIAKDSLFIEQNGLATWKQAVTNLPVVVHQLLTKAGMTVSDIDFIIFHQANLFLINYVMQKMKIPLDRTFTNVDEIGNTGSASLGIALSEAFDSGKIKRGQKVVLAGVGAGFNFGACLFKF